MARRLVLVSHGLTAGMRRHAFGAHGDLVDRDEDAVDALSRRLQRLLPRSAPAVCCTDAPAERCAVVLGLDPAGEPALDELDYGAWTGRSLTDLAAADPAAVQRWLTDPQAAPHGGETVAGQVARVGGWLDGLLAGDTGGPLLALTHPSVVRAAVVHALELPVAAYWRLDCEPWSAVVLTGHQARWQLRL